MSRTLCDLYVYDKSNKAIHRIGENVHDGLTYLNSDIHYYNLQNGDGGSCNDDEKNGYVILRSEFGMLEDEYGIIDKRFENEIREYLKNGE